MKKVILFVISIAFLGGLAFYLFGSSILDSSSQASLTEQAGEFSNREVRQEGQIPASNLYSAGEITAVNEDSIKLKTTDEEEEIAITDSTRVVALEEVSVEDITIGAQVRVVGSVDEKDIMIARQISFGSNLNFGTFPARGPRELPREDSNRNETFNGERSENIFSLFAAIQTAYAQPAGGGPPRGFPEGGYRRMMQEQDSSDNLQQEGSSPNLNFRRMETITGEALKKDEESLVISREEGGSMLVFFNEETRITEVQEFKITDLQAGDTVFVRRTEDDKSSPAELIQKVPSIDFAG